MGEALFSALAQIPELLITVLFQKKFGWSERKAYTAASLALAAIVIAACFVAWFLHENTASS